MNEASGEVARGFTGMYVKGFNWKREGNFWSRFGILDLGFKFISYPGGIRW